MDKSPEQVKTELIEILGEEFGSQLYYLDNAIVSLHVEFKLFKELFGSGKERVDILNEASGYVAYYLSKSLFEALIMGLCRVTDPAETGKGTKKNVNLSLKTLAKHLPKEVTSAYLDLCEEATKANSFARERRNKVLAHSDIEIVLNEDGVEAASIAKIKAGLAAIREAINFIHSETRDTTIAYEIAIGPLKDHKAFLRSLYLGNKMWSDMLEKKALAVEKRDYEQLKKMEKEMELPDYLNFD